MIRDAGYNETTDTKYQNRDKVFIAYSREGAA